MAKTTNVNTPTPGHGSPAPTKPKPAKAVDWSTVAATAGVLGLVLWSLYAMNKDGS